MKKTIINNILLICVIFSFKQINAQLIISPQEAVKLTLKNNYNIKISNKSTEIADNNAKLLNSGYLPTLTGNAGAAYNLDNTEAEFADGRVTSLNDAESNRYNASLNLNYTLFDGLGRAYNYKRLKEQYNLSELEARATIENTIIELFSIYYNAAQLSENLNTLNETIEISRDRLTRSQYQFDYGQSTKLAVLNAQVDINNDSINIINTKQQLNNVKRDLNVIFGNAISDNFNVQTELEIKELLDKPLLLENSKSKNIALLQSNQNILINELSLKTNKSNLLPTVGLVGTYGWNKNNNNAASFVAVSTNTGLSGGLNLSWNLFDGGTTITNVKNAKINIETEELRKKQINIDITRNFNNLWDNYENKLLIYSIQEKNIETAKSNFDRTQEQFKIGQVNSIDFRQAQLNLLNAELSLTQAKYDAKLSELQLLQLSGELLNYTF
jgi:outer membrane protein TolC